MKLKYTLAALAATALAANAATSFHNLAGSANNQAGFGDVAGITFTVGILGADTNLSTIDLEGRLAASNSDTTDLAQFEIFSVANASTWDLSTSLGLSAETQALTAAQTNTFSFSGITLSENSSYLIVVHNRTTATNNIGWGLVDGSTDAGTQNFQNDGTGHFAGSHEAAAHRQHGLRP